MNGRSSLHPKKEKMKKILIIDNYDSFTYNLVQYVEEIVGHEIDIYRNDKIKLSEIDKYEYIILSPGPGLPKDAGIMPELIKKYAPTKKILGVCLGHQAIAEAFGGSLQNLDKVYHGVATEMRVKNGDVIFEGISEKFMAGRYHSWIVSHSTFPESLEVTAVDDVGEVMALAHKEYQVKGVQFHPESILTPEGKKMIANFLGTHNMVETNGHSPSW